MKKMRRYKRNSPQVTPPSPKRYIRVLLSLLALLSFALIQAPPHLRGDKKSPPHLRGMPVRAEGERTLEIHVL